MWSGPCFGHDVPNCAPVLNGSCFSFLYPVSCLSRGFALCCPAQTRSGWYSPRPSFCGTPNTVSSVGFLLLVVVSVHDPTMLTCACGQVLHQSPSLIDSWKISLKVLLWCKHQHHNVVSEYSGSCVLCCIVSCVTMELLPVYSVCHVPAVCLSCPL